MKNITDKTIALAGLFQCANMVTSIANKGIVDVHDLEVTVRSTLNLEPISTIAVYGQYANLRTGLDALTHYLSEGVFQREINTARYVIGMLHLSRKISKRNDLLDTIANRLERVEEQVELFGIIHENVLANLAGIYSDTISTLSPKIMVNGESSHLTNHYNADKIRAILLAGIRAGILWQQVQGRRWQILWQRRLFVTEAHRILEHEMSNQLH